MEGEKEETTFSTGFLPSILIGLATATGIGLGLGIKYYQTRQEYFASPRIREHVEYNPSTYVVGTVTEKRFDIRDPSHFLVTIKYEHGNVRYTEVKDDYILHNRVHEGELVNVELLHGVLVKTDREGNILERTLQIDNPVFVTQRPFWQERETTPAKAIASQK